MPNAENDDPGRFGPVENHVGIGSYYDTADLAFAGGAPSIWVIVQQLDDRLQPLSDVLRTLRRLGFNVVEDIRQLPERPACVTDAHSPCFAQTARTSSSVANSPRSASASEASMSAASSGVSS